MFSLPKWKPSENIQVVLWVFTCHEGLHKLENLWALDLSLCFLAASVVVARILWLTPQTFQLIWPMHLFWKTRDPGPPTNKFEMVPNEIVWNLELFWGTHSMDTYFLTWFEDLKSSKTRAKNTSPILQNIRGSSWRIELATGSGELLAQSLGSS